MIEEKREEVAEICRKHGVERLDLFGSASGAKDDDKFDHEASDLDFVVSFIRREPPALFDRYFGLKEDLQLLFGRPVDLITEEALSKNPGFAEDISANRAPMYAA